MEDEVEVQNALFAKVDQLSEAPVTAEIEAARELALKHRIAE
jgi:hypothetical protein